MLLIDGDDAMIAFLQTNTIAELSFEIIKSNPDFYKDFIKFAENYQNKNSPAETEESNQTK